MLQIELILIYDTPKAWLGMMVPKTRLKRDMPIGSKNKNS